MTLVAGLGSCSGLHVDSKVINIYQIFKYMSSASVTRWISRWVHPFFMQAMPRPTATSASNLGLGRGEERSKDRRREVDWSSGKGKRLNWRCAGANPSPVVRGGRGPEWGGAELKEEEKSGGTVELRSASGDKFGHSPLGGVSWCDRKEEVQGGKVWLD